MTVTTRLNKIEDRIKKKKDGEEVDIRIVKKTAEQYFEENGKPLSEEETQQIKDGTTNNLYIVITEAEEGGKNDNQYPN